MIKHTIIEAETILILEPNVPLEASDFEELAHRIDPCIADRGKLPGLMIHAKQFPGWANLAAFTAHMRFVKSHLKNVARLAVVSDSIILTDVSKIAEHLVDAEVRHFRDTEYVEALRWLKTGAESDLARGTPV